MSIYDTMAKSRPSLARGIVWCTACGRSLKVNSAHCLHDGWPKCCGQTMTLDSPDERKGDDQSEWPEELRVREFPEAK